MEREKLGSVDSDAASCGWRGDRSVRSKVDMVDFKTKAYGLLNPTVGWFSSCGARMVEVIGYRRTGSSFGRMDVLVNCEIS